MLNAIKGINPKIIALFCYDLAPIYRLLTLTLTSIQKSRYAILSQNLKLYGISNCDSVKKAKKWLAEQSIDFEFIDFRKQPITPEKIDEWVSKAGVEVVLNKRGTTWRKLTEEQQKFNSDQEAIALLHAEITLIKRPVLEVDGDVMIGFKEAEYEALKT